MHTVVETAEFLRAAARHGVTDDERQAIVDAVAADPRGGIALAGGLHKRLIAGRGKGKSGGYRVITFFVAGDAPVILLSVLSKGNVGNFSKAELAAMVDLARQPIGGG